MKRVALLSLLFVILAGSYSKAQTFTLSKDTSKVPWTFMGYLVEVHILAENKTSSSMTLNWKVTSSSHDPGWAFDAICDNASCLYASESGLLDGAKSFNTFPISAGSDCDFKVTFDGDAAATGTKATLAVEFTDGTTTKPGVFYAYKMGSNVSTFFRTDDEIAVFPNPASNYIDVHYSSNSDVKTISIYNLIGKVVNVYKVTDKNSARCQFTNDMPSGIYLIRISDSKGKVIATRKFTRQ